MNLLSSSLLLLSIFACLFISTYAYCAIEGSSSGPPKKLKKPVEPFILGNREPCTYYSGKLGCCNQVQLNQIRNNFIDVDIIFGNDCPICGVNLKIFWCEFACNPNQSDFIFPHEVIKHKHGDSYIEALNLTFYFSANATCELFRSCSKVPETMMMASNGQGFLQFQVEFLGDCREIMLLVEEELK